jgi:hypothetical protein
VNLNLKILEVLDIRISLEFNMMYNERIRIISGVSHKPKPNVLFKFNKRTIIRNFCEITGSAELINISFNNYNYYDSFMKRYRFLYFL